MAGQSILWIAADMRGHPSQTEMVRDIIADFRRLVGVEPKVSYGVRDGLFGMILEAEITPPNSPP